MAFFEWTEDYSVDIVEIDQQHKRLVKLISELFEAMRAGKGKDVLEKVLAGLIDYTKTHFGAEERLMSTHDYPRYRSHKNGHDELTKKVLDFEARFRGDEFGVVIQLAEFLKDWLGEHILGTDKQYASFLNAKGVT